MKRPPYSPVWIAYCTGCGVMFSQTTSYLRFLVSDAAKAGLVCARCKGSPAIRVAKFVAASGAGFGPASGGAR